MKLALPASYDGSDDAALSAVLTGCCAFLDRYCGVANGGFTTQTYDELYDGTGDSSLFLLQRPVQSITKVATIQQPALAITNKKTPMGVRATSQIVGTPTNSVNLSSQYASTGLVLTVVEDAVTSTHTLTWASYPTVQLLCDAINLVGDSWQATVMGGFAKWSTTDIRATQGAFGSRVTTSYLWIHSFDLPYWRLDENAAEIQSTMGFCRGMKNWRVIYTAGYSAFPDDLSQALAELTAATYLARSVNANTQSQSLGGYSYTQAAKEGFEGLSVMAQKTINSYRRYQICHFNAW